MFGNAILPPLTFNSNEEQTGQGASRCNKQTPARGWRKDEEEWASVWKQRRNYSRSHSCAGTASPVGGERAVFPLTTGLAETEKTFNLPDNDGSSLLKQM